jgi:hypothetical protein
MSGGSGEVLGEQQQKVDNQLKTYMMNTLENMCYPLIYEAQYRPGSK